MLNKLFLISVVSVVSSPVYADHFNQRSIIELCNEDSSFGSNCYTYVAAYRDLMGFLVFSTDEERARLLGCLTNMDLTTESITRRLAQSEETNRPGQVADLLLKEFCN